MTENSTTVTAVRNKARRQNCKVSIKNGMAVLYDWDTELGRWMPADDYYGPLTHPWTLQEVSEMLDLRTQ